MKSATFDTNIYVSALQFGGLCARLMGMARAGMFRLDASDAIIDEMAGVLRDKFGWDGYGIQDAKEKVRALANVVRPTESLCVIAEDPDDNRILECAAAADSEYIVTEDKDLLRLGTFRGIRIMRAAEFFNN